MRLEYQANPKMKLVVDGEDVNELFESLGLMQEIFGEEHCGKCKSTNLKFHMRKVGEGKKVMSYPEMVCESCGAKLEFGKTQDERMYPIRFQRQKNEVENRWEYVKDSNGRNVPLGENGWTKWNPQKKVRE